VAAAAAGQRERRAKDECRQRTPDGWKD